MKNKHSFQWSSPLDLCPPERRAGPRSRPEHRTLTSCTSLTCYLCFLTSKRIHISLNLLTTIPMQNDKLPVCCDSNYKSCQEVKEHLMDWIVLTYHSEETMKQFHLSRIPDPEQISLNVRFPKSNKNNLRCYLHTAANSLLQLPFHSINFL